MHGVVPYKLQNPFLSEFWATEKTKCDTFWMHCSLYLDRCFFIFCVARNTKYFKLTFLMYVGHHIQNCVQFIKFL